MSLSFHGGKKTTLPLRFALREALLHVPPPMETWQEGLLRGGAFTVEVLILECLPGSDVAAISPYGEDGAIQVSL